MLTDVLNVLSTNAAADIILPAMQTARQPYLFASADTTGPSFQMQCNEENQLNANECDLYWPCQWTRRAVDFQLRCNRYMYFGFNFVFIPALK